MQKWVWYKRGREVALTMDVRHKYVLTMNYVKVQLINMWILKVYYTKL